MTKGAQIAVAVLTIFGGVAWLLDSGGADRGTFQYYSSVSAFLGSGESSSERSLRVHGIVVAGSIRKDLPAGHMDFEIRDSIDEGSPLQVRLINLDIPDLFKDGAEVVVEGRMELGRFHAVRVMAKCPSKYETELGREA